MTHGVELAIKSRRDFILVSFCMLLISFMTGPYTGKWGGGGGGGGG